MGKDKRGLDRGACFICACDEYETEGSILCEYCGHTPTQHTLKQVSQTSSSGNSDEPPTKKIKERSDVIFSPCRENEVDNLQNAHFTACVEILEPVTHASSHSTDSVSSSPTQTELPDPDLKKTTNRSKRACSKSWKHIRSL